MAHLRLLLGNLLIIGEECFQSTSTIAILAALKKLEPNALLALVVELNK